MSLAFQLHQRITPNRTTEQTRRCDRESLVRRRFSAEEDNLLTKSLRWTRRKTTLDKTGEEPARGDSSHTPPHFARPDLPPLPEDEFARGCSCFGRK
jgi:hypothetical protein